MAKRFIVLVIIGAALIAGAVVYKVNQKSSYGEKFKAEVAQLIASSDLEPDRQAYAQGLLDWAHKDAYEHAFTSRRGLTGGTVNVNQYQSLVLEKMIDKAKGDGADEVAAALEEIRQRVRVD